MRPLIDQVLSAASIATNQNSGPIDSSSIVWASLQAVLTGSSPVGTIKLQCSNDKPAAANLVQDTPPTNWSDVPNTTVAVSGTGSYVIPKTEICYQWIRAVWTATSGTGAISTNLKTVGY